MSPANERTPATSATGHRWMGPATLVFLIGLVAWAYYDCRLQKFMGAEFRSDCSRPAAAPVAGTRVVKESDVARAYCPSGGENTSEACIAADSGWRFDLASARVVTLKNHDSGGNPHDLSGARIDPTSNQRRVCMSVKCYPRTSKGAEVQARISIEQVKD